MGFPPAPSRRGRNWSLSLSSFPSSFPAGGSGNASEGPGYRIVAKNSGDGPTTAPYSITDTLPSDLAPVAGEVSGKAEFENASHEIESEPLACEVIEQEVTCAGANPLAAGLEAEVIIPVDVASGISGTSVFDQASVEGGGASIAKAKLRTAIGLPAWRLTGTAIPTNMAPGSSNGQISIIATNVGGAISHGPITITDTLPEGVTATKADLNTVNFALLDHGAGGELPATQPVPSGELIVLTISGVEAPRPPLAPC